MGDGQLQEILKISWLKKQLKLNLKWPVGGGGEEEEEEDVKAEPTSTLKQCTINLVKATTRQTCLLLLLLLLPVVPFTINIQSIFFFFLFYSSACSQNNRSQRRRTFRLTGQVFIFVSFNDHFAILDRVSHYISPSLDSLPFSDQSFSIVSESPTTVHRMPMSFWTRISFVLRINCPAQHSQRVNWSSLATMHTSRYAVALLFVGLTEILDHLKAFERFNFLIVSNHQHHYHASSGEMADLFRSQKNLSTI